MALNFDLIRRYILKWRAADDVAGADVELAGMDRAGKGVAFQFALAERGVCMGAVITNGIERSIHICQADIRSAKFDHRHFTRSQIAYRSDFYIPRHESVSLVRSACFCSKLLNISCFMVIVA